MASNGCSALLTAAALLAAFSLSACGPITATTTIAEATVAVGAADGVEAEKFAVYEYTSAHQYLRKAREEEGYSDFQAAIDLAKKAKEYAEEARTKAMSNPERGLPAGGAVDTPAKTGPSGSKL